MQIKSLNSIMQQHMMKRLKASDKLLRYVKNQLSLPLFKLIQDVATQWNSTYLMMERITYINKLNLLKSFLKFSHEKLAK